MQIQNGQSMIQHLGSGGSLMLDKQGQLETQSAAGHFFQKIGDAFRSLTSSGRAAIETRNANLHMAMANMLRDDTLINPAGGEIPHPTTQTERNALAMRLGLAQALHKFPPESRAAARNLALGLLFRQGLPEQGNSAEARGKALEVMNRILNDKVVFDTLYCDFECTHEQLGHQLGEMSADIRQEFMKQKDRHIQENGMHDIYLKDVRRGAVRSINGQPPNAADYEGEFIRLIPNEKIRGFLSMMPTQAGLEGSLCTTLLSGKIKDNPHSPDFSSMQAKGLELVFPHHKFDIRVEDNKAHVRLEMNVLIRPDLSTLANLFQIASAHERDSAQNKPIGGGLYTFELVVDLTQDMEGKDIPDFELVNASRKPITFPPPISIQPEG
jgi:hypothetical protein